MRHSNKDRLLAYSDELTSRLERVEKDLASPHSADSAEQAVERENDEVLLRLKEETAAEIEQIGVALKRMEMGRYGLCAECGEEIQAARLEAVPWASQCVACADRLAG